MKKPRSRRYTKATELTAPISTAMLACAKLHEGRTTRACTDCPLKMYCPAID